MGSALPVLVQGGNLSLEIWSSDGCRPNYNAAIDTAFVLMPTGTGETEESLLACTSGRRPPARQRWLGLSGQFFRFYKWNPCRG